MRLLAASLVATALFALTGCADADPATGGAGSRTSPTGAASPSEPTNRLTVTFDADGKGKKVKSWTLECDPAGGDHPDPAGACAALAAAKEPFAPLASDAICTEIYGGPSVATIKGTWQGKPVDAKYTRENGCHIARWDNVAKVIPGTPASP